MIILFELFEVVKTWYCTLYSNLALCSLLTSPSIEEIYSLTTYSQVEEKEAPYLPPELQRSRRRTLIPGVFYGY